LNLSLGLGWFTEFAGCIIHHVNLMYFDVPTKALIILYREHEDYNAL